MTQDLLDDSDVYALLDEHRACCVSSVVQTAVSDAGLSEEGFPCLPVLGSVERLPVGLAELACRIPVHVAGP